MASGRKQASFRHRSQSDNGVIIERTPLSIAGCICPRLIACLGAVQRLLAHGVSVCPEPLGHPLGRGPSWLPEGGGLWSTGAWFPGAARGSSAVSRVRDSP